MPAMTGRPIPSRGIKITFRRASLIIAAVRGYKAGLCPKISHVNVIVCLNVKNPYSGIKLSALPVKQLQIIFRGQIQLQVVKENPRKRQPVSERENQSN
jgi:hypothetical protein